MNIQSILTNAILSGPALEILSKKTHIPKAKIKGIVAVALPLLLKGMTKNASSEKGAASLIKALGQHKDDRPAEKQLNDVDENDGAKILGHIFGDNKKSAFESIAKESGVEAADVSNVMNNIAPLVMSGLSASTSSAKKSKKSGVDLSDGFDLSDVMGLMGGALSKDEKHNEDHGSNGTELLKTLLKAF